MNIIFDLDGTLIDSSERMYRLFCELVPECGLSKEKYWYYKRNKISHRTLLEKKYPAHDFEAFNERWLSRIEDEAFLRMDCNYPDTISVLEYFKNRKDHLFLLTARQSKMMLFRELSELNLIGYFDLIMVTEGRENKNTLIDRYSLIYPEIRNTNNLFVSDMGKDILMAKKFGFITVGITHGFMSGENLEAYSPNMLIDELSELI